MAAMVLNRGGAASYYAKDGTIPYQMYYPRTARYWLPTRFRLLWIWFFERRNRHKQNPWKFDPPEEWGGAMHLQRERKITGKPSMRSTGEGLG